MPGIYAFFDEVTLDCLYVGQTRTAPHIRYYGHIKLLRNESHRRSDWCKWVKSAAHGIDSMMFTWIEDCDIVDLNKREAYWFIELDPMFYGKIPSENEIWLQSDATKAKIAESIRRHKGNTTGRNKPLKGTPEYEYKPKFSVWPRKITKQQMIRHHKDEGLSLRQIARLYDVSHVTVRNYLIDYKIK